ncbi:DUF4232 domain-containing protein [Nakamurella sp. PAMC28650]|nr:DUF4232 domain-containing protein [Nakamurella sp. PAMC28650]
MTVLAASGAVAVAGLMATAAPAGASATPPGCGNSSLAVTHTPLDGATGHDSFVLLYRNVGRGTCTLYGYPGLDAVNASGQVLAHARRTLHGFAGGAPAVSPVAVAPGGYASAVVEWTNFNTATGGACAFSRSVATTPANTSDTVHFPASVGVCNLQVHPTVAGTTRNVRSPPPSWPGSREPARRRPARGSTGVGRWPRSNWTAPSTPARSARFGS